MKRNHKEISAQPAPACWHREASSTCLRVELPGGGIHVFPYGQLVTASLARSEGVDTVKIAFASHEIDATGSDLRDLLLALQDFAVKWVRPTPQRYLAIADCEGGTISGIEVRRIE